MQDNIIDFNEITANNKAVKRLAQAFTRAGAPVVSIDPDPKVKRSSGVTFRDLHLTYADSQKVTLSIKQSGDIFAVKVNGSVQPLKAQDDQKKAVAELVKILDAGRARHQAKMARTKAELPKGIRTAAPRMEVALQAKAADLETQIVEAKATVNAMREELGEPVLDSATLDAARKALTKNQAAVISYIKKQTNIDLSGRASFLKNKIIAVDADGLSKLELNQIERIGLAYGGKFRVESNGGLGIALYINDGATFDDASLDATALDAVATPEQIQEARDLAARILDGATFDSADLTHAVASLQIALDTVETNYPISVAEGNMDQAQLQLDAAESFRAALEVLSTSQTGPVKSTLQGTREVGKEDINHETDVPRQVFDNADEEEDEQDAEFDGEEYATNENQESLFDESEEPDYPGLE